MALRTPVPLRSLPGQFLHVRCADESETMPLLRRPFSVYTERGRITEILFTVVGVGTERLARLRVGDRAKIMGPLGTWFTAPKVDRLVFTAGGVGIVPFLVLAERNPRRKMTLLWGGRSRDFLHDVPAWDRLGIERHVATEDGSLGLRGRVTDLLESKLKEWRGERILVYTCGPDAMMKAVIRICRKRRLPCQASLERRMGCALGACGACSQPVVENGDWRYSRICFEGPVYDAARLLLEEP